MRKTGGDFNKEEKTGLKKKGTCPLLRSLNFAVRC
jgi:hypothetical protein